jgi:hypothetical protein
MMFYILSNLTLTIINLKFCTLLGGYIGAAVPGGAAALPPIADTTPGDWWALAGAAILGAFATWFFTRYFSSKTDKIKFQQPVRVVIDEELHKQFVSRETFDELKERVESMREWEEGELRCIRIEAIQSKDAILAKMSEQIGKTHWRIDQMSERVTGAIGELKGEIKRIK